MEGGSGEEELIARLRAELAEKDGAIRQAAQFGQVITSRMKELETAVKDRDKELEEAYARLTEHETRAKELEKRLSSAAPTEELRTEASSAYQEQYFQLCSRYELLQEQLSEATSMNKQLHRTVEEKDTALLRYQQSEKANQELREFANHHAEQTELLSAQLDEAKRTILDLRKYNEGLKLSVEELKQTKKAAIAEASEQQRTDEEKEKIEQQLKERLLKAETRVREQDEQIAEYRSQKRKLDDAVAAMARQTQVLYKERDELSSRLADATSKIGTLVRTASQIHTQELEVSLMDDIEDTQSLDTLIPAEEEAFGGDASFLDALTSQDEPSSAGALEQQLIDNGLFDSEPPVDTLLMAAAVIAACTEEGAESQPQLEESTTPTPVAVPSPVAPVAPVASSSSSSTSSSSSSSSKQAEAEDDDSMMLPSGGNMDARCEEFFYLAATSIKIQMAIQNPQFSDGVFRINIKALHDQAIQSDVPFHEWYEWLKVALRKKQAALVSSVTASVTDPINRVEGFFDGSQIQYDDHIQRAPPTPPKAAQTPPQKRGWFGFW